MKTMKWLKRKSAIVLILAVLFTGMDLTGLSDTCHIGNTKSAQASTVDYDVGYKIPKITDGNGNSYKVINYTIDDMNTAMDRNADTNDGLLPVKVIKSGTTTAVWVDIDISGFDNLRETIRYGGKDFNLNPYYFAGYGLVVYGTPDDIDGNTYNKGWRFFGYSANKDKYTNMYAANDVDSGMAAWDKNWIYNPWYDTRVQNSSYGVSSPCSLYTSSSGKKQLASYYSKMKWPDGNGENYQYAVKTGFITESGKRSYSSTAMVEYFYLESEPTEYSNGTARGWHDTYGGVFYQTFIIPALAEIKEVPVIYESGDYEITYKGDDYAGAVLTVPITGSYGVTNYTLTLEYISGFTKIHSVKWYEFEDADNAHNDSTEYKADYIGSGTSFSVSKKGSKSGIRYAFGAVVTYETNTGRLLKYPDGDGNNLGDHYMLHKIIIKEDLQEESSGSGSIVFSPDSSSKISGNREGWVNSNINLGVSVTGDTTKSEDGSTDWTYTYKVKHPKDKTHKKPYYTTETGSASRSYTEVWAVGKFKVYGNGLTTSYYSGTSGTFTIPVETKSVQLRSYVYQWKSSSRTWGSDSAPHSGTWKSGSPPKAKTATPTETFYSRSGYYKLDKTNPTITSVSPTSSGWTNQPVDVTIDVADALSGLWRSTSKAVVSDQSYYNRSSRVSYFDARENTSERIITMDSDGIYNINVGLQDVAKNTMNPVSYGSYKIDMTEPDDAEFSDDYRSYIDDNINVSVTVGDNLSGLGSVSYVLSNSPDAYYSGQSAYVSTPEGQDGHTSFNVSITQPGSWWITVYQTDRAGNTTCTTSREYKIVRISQPATSPVQANNKYPRGTRFDMILSAFGLTAWEADNSVVFTDVPAWTDDDINYKINGAYTVTPGRTTSFMKYYDGQETGPQDDGTPYTQTKWWLAFIAPFGTPATLNRSGDRLRGQEYMAVHLSYYGYDGPTSTHTSYTYFDVIPETQIKTEIINDPF